MKQQFTTTLFIALLSLPIASSANGGNPSDTVVITLENDSKIVIYTKGRDDLRDIEKYDINRMIRDLNR